jgi:GrpB-like predicted nucleotidyltransferase (UPF0157 family)
MKKYVFKPYDKTYPQLFKKEKAKILKAVKHNCVIEHIGSTAVAGLGGKGIIDIAIAVDKSEMEAVSEQLQKLGYELRLMWSTPDRLFLRADLEDEKEEKRRYHIHLTYQASSDWKGFIGFRDYLKQHPQEALEYAKLKKKAADEVNEEGAKYRKLKEPLIDSILAKIANKERSNG